MINKQRTQSRSHSFQESFQPCKIYWINVYLHRVISTENGWNGYTSSIDTYIMNNLNSSYNQYGIYFDLIGSRNWFNDKYTDPNADPGALEIALTGIFEDPGSSQHSNAIDIYILPANIPIQGGGFVPGNNKKVMFVGGTRAVNHCSGGSTSYEIATGKVVSHEMGHCLGLPHTFEIRVGTSTDHVRNRECVDPVTCQFVNNCTACNVVTNPTVNMDNFMSYTVPNCMSEFSYEQLSLMKENLDSSMASVVNKTQGEPNDIIGKLNGPSEVAIGSIVEFKLPEEAEESESFVWSIPKGFNLTDKYEGNKVQVWIGSAAESGYVRVWKTNLCGETKEVSRYVSVTPGNCMDCQTVKIFPNPTFDKLHIYHFPEDSGDNQVLDKPQEYFIVNTHGRTVRTFRSQQRNLILNLTGISAGVYLLSIISNENISADKRKLIVLR